MKVWQHHVVEARTWQDLLIAAREYIASLTPQEWASVPHDCRPERIKGIDDLDFWHQRLAGEYLDIPSTSKATDTHREMLAFFSAAAERASELYAGSESNPGRSGEERRRRDRA